MTMLARITLLTSLCFLPFAVAQEPPKEEVSVKMTSAGKLACKKALAWMAARQNADGSWSESRYPHNTAITAFALLAFMSQGQLPGQGEYGPVVAKGAKFLIASPRAEGDGYL